MVENVGAAPLFRFPKPVCYCYITFSKWSPLALKGSMLGAEGGIRTHGVIRLSLTRRVQSATMRLQQVGANYFTENPP